MTLPASQYSLLDAQRVERLDDTTFRCYVGALQLFSLRVEPVITVQVRRWCRRRCRGSRCGCPQSGCAAGHAAGGASEAARLPGCGASGGGHATQRR